MDTLPAPWAPDIASTSDEKPRVLSNHFVGDATQDIADGINPTPLTYTATWTIHLADSEAMLAFLRSHRAQVFLWTVPRELSPRAWEATQWQRAAIDGDVDQLSVTLEERFV